MGLDLSSKALLTQDELGAVMDYQNQYPEKFGTGNQDTENIRRDMLEFLEECLAEQKNLRQKSIQAFKAAQGRILTNEKYSDADRESLRVYFTELSKQPNAGMTLSFVMDSCLAKLDLAIVRGIPIEVYGSRLTALNGAPSPFS